MAIAFNPNNILHGNDTEVWFAGEQLFDVTSIEAKINVDTETVEVLGNPGSFSRFNGYSGEGTLKKYKTNSKYLSLISDEIKTGVIPDVTIITSVKQPATGKVERIALKYVSFSEATLINLEKKALAEEEIPFNFGDFELLEVIDS